MERKIIATFVGENRVGVKWRENEGEIRDYMNVRTFPKSDT